MRRIFEFEFFAGMFDQDALIVGEGLKTLVSVIGSHTALAYSTERHRSIGQMMIIDATPPKWYFIIFAYFFHEECQRLLRLR